MFAAQVAALRQTHRCITYDHRGQGRSPDSRTPFDMEQLAADALTLIRTLSLPPCHFVGLSMGALSACDSRPAIQSCCARSR